MKKRRSPPFKPPLLKEYQQARYCIYPIGLASDSVWDVTLDGRILLLQPHPHSVLYLHPRRRTPQLTQSECWFYADCISFDHEIPAIVYPSEKEIERSGYRYIHSGPRSSSIEEWHVIEKCRKPRIETQVRRPIPPKIITKAFFMDQLLAILIETREMRHGPQTYIMFQHYRDLKNINIDYSAKYGALAPQLKLYCAALRQADFLSEFLGYYRVLESTTKTNGKNWIRFALDRLNKHDFGTVLIGHDEDMKHSLVNLINVYRKRANNRIDQLREKLKTDQAIASYLYNTVRCGIAHGRDNPIYALELPTYLEISKDAILLKMLAKMAIQEMNNRTVEKV